MMSSNDVESSAAMLPVEWKVIVLPEVCMTTLSPPTNVSVSELVLAVTSVLSATCMVEKALLPVSVITPDPVTWLAVAVIPLVPVILRVFPELISIPVESSPTNVMGEDYTPRTPWGYPALLPSYAITYYDFVRLPILNTTLSHLPAVHTAAAHPTPLPVIAYTTRVFV